MEMVMTTETIRHDPIKSSPPTNQLLWFLVQANVQSTYLAEYTTAVFDPYDAVWYGMVEFNVPLYTV